MSRSPNTRREIAPLDVPWLQHEHFPATKEACSSSDGLAAASKNSAVKVVQELKSTEEARTGDNSLDFEQLEEKLDSDKAFPQDLDDVLKERLVASLSPVEKPPSLKEHEALPTSLPFPQSENGDFSSEVQQTTKLSSSAHSVDQGSWNPKGVTHVLRNVGLVEASDKELTRRTLSSPKDDEVSQEIRLLQRQLRACIEHTNETKRKLRKKMDESKPWLSQKKEEDNSTINRYFTMWQTKKHYASVVVVGAANL
ncbi:hypothetical protein BBO99_00003109 [Phytophthora kernoviae]|uniref:Uncharacterized protein n=2 Tax=Phytophthora kernoviae TaxID=325452 RepID=A0A3R7HKM5_9STRA|nr:hypothetical protein G195_003244 [Phytophthora kernoviae 00238/432]KAG2528930.1 hypothetical protein JM16_000953 [Phytophthora kernoviae]KAG2530258.1 hypothetical protein JM18_001034 [Phytophthora kernoviae]RLN44222.1 hypothetical protein BBI17_002974 [Phytophthora kernoviae]RLN82176.1 hypothetical protein BBO99_00003109 [Phytophthora kernoviae]